MPLTHHVSDLVLLARSQITDKRAKGLSDAGIGRGTPD